jgi:hypothetical protein
MQKPKVFIGSTKEAIKFAEAIKSKLQDIAAVTVWEEIFNPGRATLEDLIESLPKYDFAVLILTNDDITESRGVSAGSPRDNIIFELGLFMGRIGRLRTFFLCGEGDNLKIPSDLKGITYIPFDSTSNDEASAVADACKRIRQQIRNLGVFKLFQSAPIINQIRMTSWKEIYSRAASLVKDAEKRVRATSFGKSSEVEAEKKRYFENLAKRASEQKKQHVDFKYMLVCSSASVDPQRDDSLRERKEIFDRFEVFNCLQAKEIEHVWGIDLLIIDDKHLHVSFQSLGNEALKLGLELTDAGEFVREIVHWYDEYLFATATPIDWGGLL